MGPVLWNDGVFWGSRRLTQGNRPSSSSQPPRPSQIEPDIDPQDYRRVMGSGVEIGSQPVPDIDPEDYRRVMGRYA